MKFDKQNNNTKWGNSIALEMVQLMEHDYFINKGKFQESNIPKG